jgi:hypothetical protein
MNPSMGYSIDELSLPSLSHIHKSLPLNIVTLGLGLQHRNLWGHSGSKLKIGRLDHRAGCADEAGRRTADLSASLPEVQRKWSSSPVCGMYTLDIPESFLTTT